MSFFGYIDDGTLATAKAVFNHTPASDLDSFSEEQIETAREMLDAYEALSEALTPENPLVARFIERKRDLLRLGVMLRRKAS